VIGNEEYYEARRIGERSGGTDSIDSHQFAYDKHIHIMSEISTRVVSTWHTVGSARPSARFGPDSQTQIRQNSSDLVYF
jgi:hypothetical protein